jgi:catechol 2,3-dioxygenase-like lactoylglutathione lyase family enzyme
VKISLLVLRCFNLESSKKFYESLGCTFVKEQHEGGPIHYSTIINETVLELYPTKNSEHKDLCRLGFTVKNLKIIAEQLSVLSTYNGSVSPVYVVVDPDGRKVELSQ